MKKLLLLIIATFVLVIIGCDTNTDIESPQTQESSTNQDGDTDQTQGQNSSTNQNNDNETETNDNSAEEQENNNKDNSVIIDKENDDYYVEDDVLYINFLQKYDYFSCDSMLRNNIPSSGKIVLTDKCTEIPMGIFAYLTDLKSITISGSVKNIGERAFCNCKNLETVIMEEGVESISRLAFWGCSNLIKIDFPSTLNIIEWNPFKDCEKITFDSLPEGLVEIGGMAFYNCTFLGEELEIPKNVTHIGGSAFAGCSLHKVIIYDNLQDFSNAFDESGITELQIGDSVQYGYGNFGSNHFFSDTLEKVTIILNEATAIGEYMFWKCSKLSNVTITKSHNEKITIGEAAFSGCSSLKEFPFEIVGKIEERAFEYCAFVQLDLSASYIGKNAFTGCHELRKINLNQGVEEIAESAFSYICYMTEKKEPIAVEKIELYISDTIQKIQRLSFGSSVTLYVSFENSGIWHYLKSDGTLIDFSVEKDTIYTVEYSSDSFKKYPELSELLLGLGGTH